MEPRLRQNHQDALTHTFTNNVNILEEAIEICPLPEETE